MSWLYGQTWLWYLIAFLVGVLLAWLFLVLPQQRRLRALQHRGTAAPAAAPAASTEDDTVALGSVPAAAAVGLGGAGLAAAAVAEHAADSGGEAEPEPVTEQLPAVDPALSTLDTGALTDGADDRTGRPVALTGDPTPADDSPTQTIPAATLTTGDGDQVGDGSPDGETAQPTPATASQGADTTSTDDTTGDGPGTGTAAAAAGAAVLGGAALATSDGDGEPTDDPTTEFPTTPSAADGDATPPAGTAAQAPGPGAPDEDATPEDASGTAADPATDPTADPADDEPAGFPTSDGLTGTEAGAAAVGGTAPLGAAGAHALADTPATDASTPAADPTTAEPPVAEAATATTTGVAAGAGVLGIAGMAAARGTGKKPADTPAGVPYGEGSARPAPDGSAPGPEYTIKGNGDSMLYHAPESPYFVRTRAEAWFTTAEAAEAAGFQPWHRNRKRAAVQGLASAAPTFEAGPYPGSAKPTADGSAPTPAFMIKGNADSMLYHLPTSPYYGRTKAEVWFVHESDARAAGFTAWQRKRAGK